MSLALGAGVEVRILVRHILRPGRTQSDAMIGTTENGAAFTAGGVSGTLRDLARFGMLFTDEVRAKGDPVISDAYMEKIQLLGRPELTLEDPSAWPRTALEDGSFKHNFYPWDIVTEDGHFFRSGFGGQGLYVAPDLDVVIAWFGTQDEHGNTEMLSVARQLASLGVFYYADLARDSSEMELTAWSMMQGAEGACCDSWMIPSSAIGFSSITIRFTTGRRLIREELGNIPARDYQR